MLASQCYGSVYSHSPPAGFLADYGMPLQGNHLVPPSQRTIMRGTSAPCFPTLKPVLVCLAGTAPRSCIKNQSAKPKKVVFADDRGLQLEQVRFMTEPSHVPPYWTLRVLSKQPRVEKVRPKQPQTDVWELRFSQPSEDYVAFQRRVNDGKVALERVTIKESEGVLEGSVKVNNIDYAKEVFVRSTADGWRRSEDTYCAFLDSGPGGTYDTFSFRIQLPVQSRRLEFCIGYRCAGQEFWDSNESRNYVVEKRSARSSGAAFCGAVHSGNSWNLRQAGDTPYW